MLGGAATHQILLIEVRARLLIGYRVWALDRLIELMGWLSLYVDWFFDDVERAFLVNVNDRYELGTVLILLQFVIFVGNLIQ